MPSPFFLHRAAKPAHRAAARMSLRALAAFASDANDACQSRQHPHQTVSRAELEGYPAQQPSLPSAAARPSSRHHRRRRAGAHERHQGDSKTGE